ncbi:MAG: hypothetical protein ACK5MJ_01785 [Alphaproteobacteria bacterium]
MKKAFLPLICLINLTAQAGELPFNAPDEILDAIYKENEKLSLSLSHLPLQMHTTEITGETPQSIEYLTRFVTTFAPQMSEEQHIAVLAPFMDVGNKKAVQKITNIVKPQLAQFAKKNQQIECNSYVFQGLIAFNLEQEITDIDKLVNHPICHIQIKLLENSAENNQRPSKDLWDNLLQTTLSVSDKVKQEQSLIYLSGEMLSYEAWDEFAKTLKSIHNLNERFKLYQQYFDAIDSVDEIPKAAHNSILASFQEDIQRYDTKDIKDVALAMQSAGYVSQLQMLIHRDLKEADERLTLRLLQSFASSDAALYAENTLQYIENPFVKAKGLTLMVQYLATKPLAGDDPYLERAISAANSLEVTAQRDDIYKDLSLIALETEAIDTAMALVEEIQNSETKDMVLAQFALYFSNMGNDEAAQQIMNKMSSLALNQNILHHIFTADSAEPWLNMLGLYAPIDVIEKQLQLIGQDSKDIDNKRGQIIDYLIGEGLYHQAKNLSENIQNPWLKADKYLYLYNVATQYKELLEQALDLLQNSNMNIAGDYLESITSHLLTLDKDESVQSLYDKAPSAAERIPILNALMIKALE